MNRTATCSPAASRLSISEMKAGRLARPVSGSWLARTASSAWERRNIRMTMAMPRASRATVIRKSCTSVSAIESPSWAWATIVVAEIAAREANVVATNPRVSATHATGTSVRASSPGRCPSKSSVVNGAPTMAIACRTPTGVIASRRGRARGLSRAATAMITGAIAATPTASPTENARQPSPKSPHEPTPDQARIEKPARPARAGAARTPTPPKSRRSDGSRKLGGLPRP